MLGIYIREHFRWKQQDNNDMTIKTVSALNQHSLPVLCGYIKAQLYKLRIYKLCYQ